MFRVRIILKQTFNVVQFAEGKYIGAVVTNNSWKDEKEQHPISQMKVRYDIIVTKLQTI